MNQKIKNLIFRIRLKPVIIAAMIPAATSLVIAIVFTGNLPQSVEANELLSLIGWSSEYKDASGAIYLVFSRFRLSSSFAMTLSWMILSFVNIMWGTKLIPVITPSLRIAAAGPWAFSVYHIYIHEMSIKEAIPTEDEYSKKS